MDYDEYNQDQQIKIKAPNWFVQAMKEFRLRNSIKMADIDFAMYLTLQYESNKEWITEGNIRNALQIIGSKQTYPHLPDDKDWYKTYSLFMKEIQDNYIESEKLAIEDNKQQERITNE